MLDETLTYALIMVVKTHRLRIAAQMAPLGLHAGQELLLNQLWKQDGLTQSELIARLGVEPPTVTKTVQRLERAGFLRREPDKRAIRVFLTDAGKALQEPVERIWQETDELIQREFGPQERETLADLVTTMADNAVVLRQQVRLE
ncbi:MAG: MarR family transcriptional regulator [Nonomuraea sp.]|nr:MarR family transcriptional regulator [Nonomuraea sp.]